MIFYIKDPKSSTKRLVFHIVTGYKVNNHKSIAFLYISNKKKNERKYNFYSSI